ncbi:MAG: hypothetical protein ACXW13_08710, partial [Burkholderiaceae bacterium]
MTTEHNPETRAASPDTTSPGPASARRSRLRRAFSWTRGAAVDAGRASAPTIKRISGRLGDWLATVGWGKFFLVALLLLIVGAIADNVFFDAEPVVVVKVGEGEDRVQVNLQVAPDGVRIQAPSETPPSTASDGDASVKIDDKGLRISTGDKGERVSVVIDEKGVRVERQPPNAKGGTETPAIEPSVTVEEDGRTVTIGPEFTKDPQQLALALDKARDQIEDIVEKQIERQIARETRRYRENTGDWLMSFVMLLIMAGIIVKVVLGGKRRAERRAEAA